MTMLVRQKVTVSAEDINPGECGWFQGMEVIYQGEFTQYSDKRSCVPLGSRAISGSFNWDTSKSHDRIILRFRGMWDMYKKMPQSLSTMINHVDMRGSFEFKINGKTVFNDWIHFLNYREWRFWPAVELVVSQNILQEGDNRFTIINHTKAFKLTSNDFDISDSYLKNTIYQVSDIQFLGVDFEKNIDSFRLPKDTFIGTIVAGHNVYHISDISWNIDRFIHDNQGNLLVFLTNHRMGGSSIDWDKVDAEKIVASGCYVAFRYYGSLEFPGIDEAIYHEKLLRFIDRLGNHFLGFGPHEQHGEMRRLCQRSPHVNLSEYPELYRKTFHDDRIIPIRNLTQKGKLWVTDPSLYSRLHIEEGADYPATELCVRNISIDVASQRGTTLGLGKDFWACINSFECQAYGGLSYKQQHVMYEKDFAKKRENLWRISNNMAYLGGARILYGESCLHDHKITIQKEFDDPHVASMRKIQTDLLKFIHENPLKGQPHCEIAFLQGQHDIFKGVTYPDFSQKNGGSDYSWKLLESALVNVRGENSNGNDDAWFEGECQIREMISDTPFGDADIVPAESTKTSLMRYKALTVCGWNTLDNSIFQKLLFYVKNGGILFIMLPQLSTSCQANNNYPVDNEILKELCGVEQTKHDETDWDIPINVLELEEKEKIRFQGLRQHLKKLPKSQSFREPIYNSYARDLTIVSEDAKTILTEASSGVPFMVQNKLGTGQCYLINLNRFSRSYLLYQTLNMALRDIYRTLPSDVVLTQGEGINFYVYDGQQEGELKRIYVLDNEWYVTENNQDKHISFAISGQSVELDLPQGKIIRIIVHKDRGIHYSTFM
jgi:hypothetical protein